MSDKGQILVGKIVAPQGIRGEVRVQTYSENPMDFQKFDVHSSRFADGDFRFVRRLNPTSDVIIARVRGYEDRTAAEGLRGTELFISRDTLPSLAADEYYQADLIGFDVVHGGVRVGRVACFQNFGAGDIIELDNGDMLSFVGANVNLDTKTIIIE